MTTTKKDSLQAIQKECTSIKCAKGHRNTFEVTYPDGSKAYRLHKTDIVTYKGDNVTLNSGGWRTATTKARINDFCVFHLVQEKGLWKVKTGSGIFDFYDGITLNTLTGNIVGKARPVLDEKKINTMKAKIKKFVNRLDTMKQVPVPQSGDCWDCSFRTSDGVPMGELGNSDHLLNHVKEGYLHGSLIVNALKAYGYSDERLPYVIRIKDIANRALTKYLKKKLIPELAF